MMGQRLLYFGLDHGHSEYKNTIELYIGDVCTLPHICYTYVGYFLMLLLEEKTDWRKPSLRHISPTIS